MPNARIWWLAGILVFIIGFLFGYIFIWLGQPRPAVTPSPPPAAQQPQSGAEMKITVYYVLSEPNRFWLVPETRAIPATKAVARAALEELLKGPQPGSGLLPALPAGVRINSLTIKDGVARVDFSRELRDRFNGGSALEELMIMAVVNTLTEFSTVQKVKITMDGQERFSPGGHMLIDGTPFTRKETVIKRW